MAFDSCWVFVKAPPSKVEPKVRLGCLSVSVFQWPNKNNVFSSFCVVSSMVV